MDRFIFEEEHEMFRSTVRKFIDKEIAPFHIARGMSSSSPRRPYPGPCGIAYDGTALWVSNYRDDTVVRIDPATNEVTDTLSMGPVPQDVQVGLGKILVTRYQNGLVFRVDPAKRKVIAKIKDLVDDKKLAGISEVRNESSDRVGTPRFEDRESPQSGIELARGVIVDQHLAALRHPRVRWIRRYAPPWRAPTAQRRWYEHGSARRAARTAPPA